MNILPQKGRGARPCAPTRFAVVLEYDGSAFAGWQYQDNAHTVQAALEAAIAKRFGEKRRVGGASRTDTGVHARGQVAVFDLAHTIPADKIVPALNSALPATVRVLKAKIVPADWDPRRKSKRKTYSYLIHNRPVYSPLWLGKAWQIYQKLDLAVMRQAARSLVGKHDFTSFRASGCEAKHPVRNVQELRISCQGALIKIRITADAFLYHMVRNIVGTLVEIGRHKIPAGRMKKILQTRDRQQAGPTAPACGLYLDKVSF